MDIEERLNLIKAVGEEIIEETELRQLLQEKESFLAYDGFEPSGNMHIAQAVLRAVNVNRIIEAGGEFIMFVADWHAWANHKFGGDLEKIQTAGKYFIEIWKAAGMRLDKVRFVWGSELIKDPAYWGLVMKVATSSTLSRILRTTQIMGRSESDTLSASQIFYPCMQAADIFHFGVDICQLGMDQRKVNVLARELAAKLGKKKPIIVSHAMLMGLEEPPKEVTDPIERATAMKMSKSRPDSSIFISDDEKTVQKKIAKAYCPAQQVEENPVLDYYKQIIFALNDEVVIERPEKFGGTLTFTSYHDLEAAFVKGELHPMDLKQGCAKYINHALEPIRTHFAENAEAKALQEQVMGFSVTR